MSKAHNPIQDIYLRVVENKEQQGARRGGQGAGRLGRRLQDGLTGTLCARQCMTALLSGA
jgi:hypothetical protein